MLIGIYLFQSFCSFVVVVDVCCSAKFADSLHPLVQLWIRFEYIVSCLASDIRSNRDQVLLYKTPMSIEVVHVTSGERINTSDVERRTRTMWIALRDVLRWRRRHLCWNWKTDKLSWSLSLSLGWKECRGFRFWIFVWDSIFMRFFTVGRLTKKQRGPCVRPVARPHATSEFVPLRLIPCHFNRTEYYNYLTRTINTSSKACQSR